MKTNTRDKLIETSIELMTRKGFNNTGIGQILKEAKVPKGSFYHYFASKDDLGAAVLEQCEQGISSERNDYFANAPGTPLEKLRNYFEAGIKSFEEDFSSCNCVFGNWGQELATEHEGFREKISIVFQNSEDVYAHALEEAKAAGEISENANCAQLAEFLQSGWAGSILRAKLKKSVEPLKTFFHIYFDQLLPNLR